MKRKVVTCDICGRDMTKDRFKYKFKEYKYDYNRFDMTDYSGWHKLDMCECCYNDLIEFMKHKAKEG